MSRTPKDLRSPLRWAGSKRRLLPELRLACPSGFERYVEPFAGSACLFFALRPPTAILNDLNAELLNFYEELRSHPRLIARLASSMPSTSTYYYQLRSASVSQLSSLERAVRFFYLNRYCFNGVYRTNKKGLFNVPRGVNTGNMPAEGELYRCSLLLRRAQLRIGDFSTVLQETKAGDFVFDAASRGAKIVLSYRESPHLASLLPGWNCRKILVRRHVAGFAASRRFIGEMLLANFPLPAA
jgi:DNA adenine methylase